MNKIQLRSATIEDLAVLESWDDQPHLKDQVPTEDWLWEEELSEEYDWRNQFIAELDGIPIGYIDIIDPHHEPEQYWGKIEKGFRALDIWIGNPDYLGKGHGSDMMQLAIDFCFSELEVHTILIDPYSSNIKAIKFYEKLGFEFVENREFEGILCSVHRYTREQFSLDSND